MVVKEEMNKFAIDYPIALGWIAATLIYQIGRVIIDGLKDIGLLPMTSRQIASKTLYCYNIRTMGL